MLLLASAVSLRAVEKLDFNKDVRPILSDNCFACHGPDEKKIKGDLRLDSHAAAVKGGKSDGAGHRRRRSGEKRNHYASPNIRRG